MPVRAQNNDYIATLSQKLPLAVAVGEAISVTFGPFYLHEVFPKEAVVPVPELQPEPAAAPLVQRVGLQVDHAPDALLQHLIALNVYQCM